MYDHGDEVRGKEDWSEETRLLLIALQTQVTFVPADVGLPFTQNHSLDAAQDLGDRATPDVNAETDNMSVSLMLMRRCSNLTVVFADGRRRDGSRSARGGMK